MKYHIDTIPVWDALKLEGECMLCALERKTELNEADRYLGASVMEPDTRIQVNRLGFCRHHHAMLFGMSNRLGHALMLESHHAETRKRAKALLGKIKKAAQGGAAAPLGGFSRAGQKARKDVSEIADEIRTLGSSCIMCGSIRDNMERYLHTFFHLYQTDSEFRKRFLESKGVCLPHLADLLRVGQEELSGRDFASFVEKLEPLQDQNMDRMQEDISWFIKKFDYRYAQEPWKNSQDAVPRTVNKLRGWCIGAEPNPEK